MKTNKLVKLGIATFAVAVLGVVPAFTAQADTNVAEQPNTVSKPAETSQPEVKLSEEINSEHETETNPAESQPSDTPEGHANSNEVETSSEEENGSNTSFNNHVNKVKEVRIGYRFRIFTHRGGWTWHYAPTDEARDYSSSEKYPSTTIKLHPGESYTLPAPPTIEGYVFESMSRSGMNPGDTINYDNAPTETGSSSHGYHISYLYRKATEHSIDQKIDPILIGAQVGEDGYSELDDKFPEKYIELLAGESYTFPNVEIDGYRLKKIINTGPDGNELSYKVGDVIHYRNNAGDDLDRGPYFSYVYEKVQSGSSNKSDPKSIENPGDQPQPANPEKPAEKPSEKPVVPDTPKPVTPAVPDQPQPANPEKPAEKPETKPSETPKPEVKPETKPSETPKPEVKPAPKPSDTPKPEVKPETKPSETPKPEVKPETKPSDTPKPEVKPETKPSETPKPEVKPAPKPSDTPKPEVEPAPKPSETPKPEVKPAPKPSDASKPEVKPETKPSDTSNPEVKPEPKPSDTSKPEVKPEPNPSETPKPEVKPAPKPYDTSKPEVKPELKPQTNSNTAPTAPVKPVGQTSNSKADKPTSKKETPALPNTGEQSSSLSLFGLLLASLGLAGLTYKGRH